MKIQYSFSFNLRLLFMVLFLVFSTLCRAAIETPTDTPTPKPTPTYTNTPTLRPTSLPKLKELFDEFPLSKVPGSYKYLAVHPLSGEIYGSRYESYVWSFYILPPPSDSEFSLPPRYPSIPSLYDNLSFTVGPDGTIYYLYRENFITYIRAIRFDGSMTKYPIYKYDNTNSYYINFITIYVVLSKDKIPGTQPGDILVLDRNDKNKYYWNSEILKIDPSHENQFAVPLVTKNRLPDGIRDFCIGPEGYLYFVTFADDPTSIPIKIYRLDEDGYIREYIHSIFSDIAAVRIRYLSQDHAFYLVIENDPPIHIIRVSEDGKEVDIILPTDMSNFGNDIDVSPDGRWLYYMDTKMDQIVGLKLKNPKPTSTPTPVQPSPTPTPIRAWFVLDGYGGIHSTNPQLKLPTLPYFAPFDIVRDIEPDPLGRGWYMLDGYGGIHTFPYDLPKPTELPYFGFDIARNLEITQNAGVLHFYLLDGFGVIHTDDRDFQYGNLPWFDKDMARDLEPDPQFNGWMILDCNAFLYFSRRPALTNSSSFSYDWLQSYPWFKFSENPAFDYPLHETMRWNPIARGIVRFPDDRSVVIDSYGGPHTNPYYPASDVIYGLPEYFYFPGWEIIYDAEVVPENWNP